MLGMLFIRDLKPTFKKNKKIRLFQRCFKYFVDITSLRDFIVFTHFFQLLACNNMCILTSFIIFNFYIDNCVKPTSKQRFYSVNFYYESF